MLLDVTRDTKRRVLPRSEPQPSETDVDDQ